MAISARRAAKSGRFLLRLPPPVHAMLDAAARDAGLSLNEYCVRRLAAGGSAVVDDAAAEVVTRAATVAGSALIAVVLHGSLARNEATAASDADILVVVESRLTLRRGLYRTWDAHPVRWRSAARPGARLLRRRRPDPSDFYRQADADSARATARRVVELVRPHVPPS